MGACHDNAIWCFLETSFYNPVYEPVHRLPALNADPDTITVSGFSGGAVIANAFHVAYSETVKGAAIFSGTAFGDSIIGPGAWTSQKGIALADSHASGGKIDSLSNLKNAPVYLTSGGADKVMYPEK